MLSFVHAFPTEISLFILRNNAVLSLLAPSGAYVQGKPQFLPTGADWQGWRDVNGEFNRMMAVVLQRG